MAGRHSLGRAFLVNGAGALSVGALIAVIMTRLGAGLDDVPRLMLGLARETVLLGLGAWAMIGLWRAASRAARRRAKRIPAAVAKLYVLLATVAGLQFLVSTVPGRIAILDARLDPSLNDYLIARTAPDEVTFTGALNDSAVRELKEYLSRPAIKVLRITSHGGLITPVMGLAEIVAAKKIAVVARQDCLSTCTLLLAASPSAIVTPMTRVVFHKPAPPATLTSSTNAAALALVLADWHARYRDYGMAPGAVAEMSRRTIWAPGLKALADMGLIQFVLDGTPAKLTAARVWCRTRAAACGPPPPLPQTPSRP